MTNTYQNSMKIVDSILDKVFTDVHDSKMLTGANFFNPGSRTDYNEEIWDDLKEMIGLHLICHAYIELAPKDTVKLYSFFDMWGSAEIDGSHNSFDRDVLTPIGKRENSKQYFIRSISRNHKLSPTLRLMHVDKPSKEYTLMPHFPLAQLTTIILVAYDPFQHSELTKVSSYKIHSFFNRLYQTMKRTDTFTTTYLESLDERSNDSIENHYKKAIDTKRLSYVALERIFGLHISTRIVEAMEGKDGGGFSSLSINPSRVLDMLSYLIMIPDVFSRGVYLESIITFYKANKTRNSDFNGDYEEMQDFFFLEDDPISEIGWLDSCHKYLLHLALNFYPFIEREFTERLKESFPEDGEKVLLEYINNDCFFDKIVCSSAKDVLEIQSYVNNPTTKKIIEDLFYFFKENVHNIQRQEKIKQITHPKYWEIPYLKKVALNAVEKARREKDIFNF